MRTNDFNKIYESYILNDDFDNISIYGFASMTQKQRDKFAILMIKKGCVIRRNQANKYYVYNNNGIGMQISRETLISIINEN